MKVKIIKGSIVYVVVVAIIAFTNAAEKGWEATFIAIGGVFVFLPLATVASFYIVRTAVEWIDPECTIFRN